MKKLIIATFITASSLTGVIYAQTPGQNPYAGLAADIDQGIQSGIMNAGLLSQQDFDQKYALAANWVNNQTFPITTNTPLTANLSATPPQYPLLSITNTPYLNNLQLTNGAGIIQSNAIAQKINLSDIIEQQTTSATEANIYNSLNYLVFDMHANHYDTQKTFTAKKITYKNENNQMQPVVKEERFQDYADDNSLFTLINGKKPSTTNNNTNNDGTLSLYIAVPDLKRALVGHQSYLKNKYLLNKPAVNNDDFLNFSTLFSPAAYNARQTEAAKKYIVYAAESTKNLAADLDLKKLLPTSLDDTQKKNLPTVIANLKHDDRFLKYIMKINTMVAIRSISLNILEHLIAERTPVKGLGEAAGKKTDSASPLEVEAYQANHRIKDPFWYKTIQQESPATIQRSILIELAEIEHQNYQAHLDRERILAALTAANLSSNLSGSMLLKESAMQANDAIKDAVKQYNPSAPQGPSEKTPSSTTPTTSPTNPTAGTQGSASSGI